MALTTTAMTFFAGSIPPGIPNEHEANASVEDDSEHPHAQEEIVVEEEPSEEAAPIRTSPDPECPTAKQLEEHRLTHSPFRTWCRWCIMGRGRGQQHRVSDAKAIVIIGLDYFYLTDGGIKKRSELADLGYSLDDEGSSKLKEARCTGEIVKCILMRCL